MNTKITRQICIHFAKDVDEGQYRRISKLNNDIHALTKSRYIEFQVVGLLTSLKEIRGLCGVPPVVSSGRKYVLPILLPGSFRSSFIYFVNSLISRILGVFIGLFLSPDICVGETHNSANIITGVRIASAKIKIFSDFHGACPEEISYVDFNKHRTGRIVDQYNMLEKLMLHNSDMVVCQSAAMSDHLSDKHGGIPCDCIVYSCGVDADLFDRNCDDGQDARAELQIEEGEIVFVYLGGFHRWQLIENVFKIFAVFSEKYSVYKTKLLVLTGEPVANVISLASKFGVMASQLRVLKVSHNVVPRYLSACDFGFLLREDNVLNRVASPTKLGEYLSCGVPVVASHVSEFWISREGLADTFVIVDHSSPENASMAIYDYLNSHGGRVSQQARLACRKLAAEKLSRHYDFASLYQYIKTHNK